MNVARISHAWSAAPSASADCALATLSVRLVPGPTPATAASRSVSCSAAPLTRTTNDALALLLAASAALQLTVVVPIGNTLPEAGEQATGTSPSILETIRLLPWKRRPGPSR